MAGNDESQVTESSQELWEVLDILDETRWQYLVTWAGTDPETGRPWEPSWTDKPLKSAPELVKAWNAKKAKKDASKRKGKQREREQDRPPKQSLKRKRGDDSTSRGGSETSRRTRSTSITTALSHKSGVAAKSRKTMSPSDSNKATSSNTRPEPEEVIPETQSDAEGANNIPLESGQPPLRDSTGTSEPSNDELISNRAAGNPHRSNVHSKRPVGAPRKSNLSASKTVLQKGPPRPYGPIPVVTPSVFKKYLPSQDPIEDFSSPEKPRKKRHISDTIQESSPSPDKDPLLLVQEMEEAYIQFADDPHPRPVSPVQRAEDTGGLASHPTLSAQWASPIQVNPHLNVPISNTKDDSRVVDQSSLFPLPSTASTQLAVIDSQSQIVQVPDSQDNTDDEEKLEAKAELARLRLEIGRLEDELDAALLQNGEADMQILDLEGQLEECRKAQASVHSQAKFLEQVELLKSAQAQADELHEVVLNMQETARASWEKVAEEHVYRLRTEVRRWKSMYEILAKRDQRTDEDVRRKAAEHVELTARVSELESRLHIQGEEHARRVAEYEEKNTSLRRELEEARQQLDSWEERAQEVQSLPGELDALQNKYDILDSEAGRLREELAHLTGIKTRLEDLLSSQKSQKELNTSPTQSQGSDLYVCRYQTCGEPCYGLFFSEDDARSHVYRTHYPFIDEDPDARTPVMV